MLLVHEERARSELGQQTLRLVVEQEGRHPTVLERAQHCSVRHAPEEAVDGIIRVRWSAMLMHTAAGCGLPLRVDAVA